MRCMNHHFTVAIKDGFYWIYSDDMCVSVRHYNSFEDLLHQHPNGWFFALFKKISIRVSDVPQGNSNLGELLTDNYLLLVLTLQAFFHNKKHYNSFLCYMFLSA